MQDQNPYAPPKTEVLYMPGSTGVWREGKLLVMRKGAELPDRCIYCNEPAQLSKNRRLFYLNIWLQMIFVLLFLAFNVLAVIPIIVISMIFRKQARVDIPVCRRHWRKRILLTSVTLLALAITIGLAFVSIQATGLQEILLKASLAFFVVAIILAFITGSLLRAKKIDAEMMLLKGAKQPFLDSLPEYAGE